MEKFLLHQLKFGDEKAFKFIFDQYYDQLCNFANLITHSPVLSEEIVDDVIFNLWENRETVQIVYSLRTYLMRSVRNRCLSELGSLHHRMESAESRISVQDNIEFLDSVFTDSSHPLGTLLEQELEEKVKEAVDSMPDMPKRVFLKSRLENKKYGEIAQELSVSVNTVKYHMKNAISFMHQHLAPYLKMFLVFYFFGHH